jgi:hypothetical protein
MLPMLPMTIVTAGPAFAPNAFARARLLRRLHASARAAASARGDGRPAGGSPALDRPSASGVAR